MTPYREVAKQALMSWNGLSETEAQKFVETASFEEVEGQCWAKDSITAAANSLASYIGLDTYGKNALMYCILGGPNGKSTTLNEEDELVLDTLRHDLLKAINRRNKSNDKQIYAQFILPVYCNILSDVHDAWLSSNTGKFNKTGREDKRFQHLPLELIGWEEAKKDLLFINPIMGSLKAKAQEEMIEMAYEDRVTHFFEVNGLKTREDIIGYIVSKNKGALLEEHYPVSLEVAGEMANQVIERMPENLKKRLNLYTEAELAQQEAELAQQEEAKLDLAMNKAREAGKLNSDFASEIKEKDNAKENNNKNNLFNFGDNDWLVTTKKWEFILSFFYSKMPFILLTPAPQLSSFKSLKCPSSPVCLTCGPPHISTS